MNKYLRFETINDNYFDVCCTDFIIDFTINTIHIYDGYLNKAYSIKTDNISSIESIEKDYVGIDYKCYNDISFCISSEGLVLA